ncbi:MAG: hypothetical protein ACKVOR_02905 [Flavobacteriales bacterium]
MPTRKNKLQQVLYVLVLLIGLLQIIGYVSGVSLIRGLGAATCSAPLPLVFGEVKGVETFAADFFVEFENDSGETQRIQITPAEYSLLAGPYNRRNVYGAAISYGPVLKEEIWQSILQYALCDGSLQREMNLPTEGKNYRIYIQSKTAGSTAHWTLHPQCD